MWREPLLELVGACEVVQPSRSERFIFGEGPDAVCTPMVVEPLLKGVVGSPEFSPSSWVKIGRATGVLEDVDGADALCSARHRIPINGRRQAPRLEAVHQIARVIEFGSKGWSFNGAGVKLEG